MIPLPSGTRIWLVAGATDMRKSFNGLGELVQHVLDDNPFSGHLRCFCSYLALRDSVGQILPPLQS